MGVMCISYAMKVIEYVGLVEGDWSKGSAKKYSFIFSILVRGIVKKWGFREWDIIEWGVRDSVQCFIRSYKRERYESFP